VVRTSILSVSLALVVAACSGAAADSLDAGAAGGGDHDGAPDGTLADAPTGDVAPGMLAEDGGDAADAMADATDATDATVDTARDSVADGPCSTGQYEGMLTGLYTSRLTGVGIPIPIEGNVAFALAPAGNAGMTCTFNGVSEDCGNVFALQHGGVTGTANALQVGDATTGGFPFFCSMTGALDCAATKFVGWIECKYCIGPLADGGGACALLSGVGGTTGVGGNFAGPLTADYDAAAHAFVMGTWNASEALAGNDGTMPGPDGAPISDFLSDSGQYFGPNDFGGSGPWTAMRQ
jgi:hypothetical protein